MLFEGGAAGVLLVIALWFDVKFMRIPNVLTATAAVCALLYHGISGGFTGIGTVLAGTAAGLIPMLFLYLLKGIGAGDVKLFAALGAWVGPLPVLQIMVYSILFAGLIGIVLLIVHRPFFTRVVNILMPPMLRFNDMSDGLNQAWKQGLKFPFMLAVAPGAVAVWYFSFS
ncbi:prepilin peptidase [Paenibacillus sp. GCM10012307]|uniref:Prepilin peptidase n=1 Tax=Paenibacillus roseus TaxID=2798579 RepID=A0A934J6S8_9BACL|nr:prepilin peptidase [Paenibacillus roseus]MBJ6361430.1 prepilin peptidase [Paenibacillus roseus]